jgi:chromosome segregation ATPase
MERSLVPRRSEVSQVITVDKLVDEEAGKTAGLLARMKEMFRKKVEEEIMKVEKETQVLSEETDKEENIKRKIRELIVREGLLKEELAATKTEMDALGQQNEVLGRDIHTCNYERVNLTTQLQKSKKEYEDLKRKIEEKKASQKKAHQQFISKHTHVSNESDHRNTTKQEGTSAVLAQGGDKIEAETINERKSIKFSPGTGALGGLEIRKIEEDAADYDIDEDDDQLPVISEGNRSNNLKTSKNNLRVKKSKKKMYAFVNGKLERRFVIDDK